jgi:transcription elongation factor Elf1
MKTGYETTKPSTGIAGLHCPQCRRKHLLPRQGTVTVQRGKETKKVPTAFAECGHCGLLSSVEERQFTHELYLVETFFPGNQFIELT